MIPRRMNAFLRKRLPLQTFENRLIRDGDRRFLEFGILDVERLSRLGIQVDKLGPRLVVAMWDEGSPQEIGGYLVVDNLAMGQPSMGGIRMLPERDTCCDTQFSARHDPEERSCKFTLWWWEIWNRR